MATQIDANAEESRIAIGKGAAARQDRSMNRAPKAAPNPGEDQRWLAEPDADEDGNTAHTLITTPGRREGGNSKRDQKSPKFQALEANQIAATKAPNSRSISWSGTLRGMSNILLCQKIRRYLTGFHHLIVGLHGVT